MIHTQKTLCQTLANMTRMGDVDDFLNDILTPSEYQDIATRVYILSLAKQGKKASEISNIAWVSLATAQRWIGVYQHGTGICKKVL